MLRAVEQLETEMNAGSDKHLTALLKDAGWRVLSVDGGASSALLGTFFAGMGDADLGRDRCDCQRPAQRASRRACVRFEEQTKARPGDKTMMDALTPAVAGSACRRRPAKPSPEALEDAAEAARMGAGVDHAI